MVALNESRHTGEFILQEGPGHFSREVITVLSGEGKLPAGQVLGKTVATATAAAAAKAGNTGNGVLTMDVTTPVLATAKAGRYVLECIEPGANVGTFQVTDPDGIVLGSHVVAGAAFATQIKFTIADGATDFVAGDAFFVDVVITAVKYRSADPTNVDGSDKGCALLVGGIDATSADAVAVALVRGPVEVIGDAITYDANVDNASKKAAKITELASAGIIVR